MKKESFNEQCYEILRTVPRGKVTTYKAIAQALGTSAFRAVGNAMNKNPNAPKVPCHRVVGSNGKLVGYAHGLKKKRALLEAEGVAISNNEIVDLKRFLFVPKNRTGRR